MSGAGRLAEIVRAWAEVNGGELNRPQTRELLKALDAIAEADEAHAAVMRRLGVPR